MKIIVKREFSMGNNEDRRSKCCHVDLSINEGVQNAIEQAANTGDE